MIYTTYNNPKNVKVQEQSVDIIPLGGLEQIGMNMTVLHYKDSIIVIDCGLAFPTSEMPGVDFLIPDVTYLKQNKEKIKGLFITHGHEDHVGAIPYVLKEINMPIFATKLTMAIIDSKLNEHDMLQNVERHVVNYGDTITAGKFKVEFIRINHSISDAAALAIFSPPGLILHTGDYKIDYTPICGDRADIQRIGELGRQGVLALLSDSTNAIKPGFTPSEQTVVKTFENIFLTYKTNRILVATFASNVNRVQLIIDSALRFNRKIAIEGRSMIKIIEIARSLGYINIPDNVLIDSSEIEKYNDDQVCILLTGSQGESMAALRRVSGGQDSKIHITPNDIVVFSSSPIPGNENAISRLTNALAMRGAKIVNKATHVSGHACEEEIKLMYALTQPKYAVPLHGEFCHRQANADIAKKMQVAPENVFMLNSGDILNVSKFGARVTGTVSLDQVMVDGLGVGDVGSMVLRDRQQLAQDGIIIVGITLTESGNMASKPQMLTRGFVYTRDTESILKEADEILESAVAETTGDNYTDWAAVKSAVKDKLQSYFWKQVKRKPMILSLILKVSEFPDNISDKKTQEPADGDSMTKKSDDGTGKVRKSNAGGRKKQEQDDGEKKKKEK